MKNGFFFAMKELKVVFAMFFSTLIIFLSVNLFFFVFLKIQRGKGIFFDVDLTKIGIMFFLYQVLVLTFYRNFNSFLFYILLIHIPFFVIFWWPKLDAKFKERSFRREFPSFLTHACVTMKSGRALRTALKESVSVFNLSGQRHMSEIIECVVFSQQKNLGHYRGFSQQVLQKISQIDQEEVRSIQKLENWRLYLNKTEYFRQKSGQILLQVRIQAILISILYLALLGFVLSSYEVKSVQGIVMGSFLLNFIGIFLCFKLGKKIKWKF